MKTLIVVDMQNDFITGPLGTPEAREIVPRVRAKIDEAVRNGNLIIYTRDSHWGNYLGTREGKKLPIVHCTYGTDGWRVPVELMPPVDYANHITVNKNTFGLYELPQKLRSNVDILEVDEIELVGVCTDICVVSNAMLLKSYFYDIVEITVDASCCAGTTPENHKAALQVMKSCQINVIGE